MIVVSVRLIDGYSDPDFLTQYYTSFVLFVYVYIGEIRHGMDNLLLTASHMCICVNTDKKGDRSTIRCFAIPGVCVTVSTL